MDVLKIVIGFVIAAIIAIVIAIIFTLKKKTKEKAARIDVENRIADHQETSNQYQKTIKSLRGIVRTCKANKRNARLKKVANNIKRQAILNSRIAEQQKMYKRYQKTIKSLRGIVKTCKANKRKARLKTVANNIKRQAILEKKKIVAKEVANQRKREPYEYMLLKPVSIKQTKERLILKPDGTGILDPYTFPVPFTFDYNEFNQWRTIYPSIPKYPKNRRFTLKKDTSAFAFNMNFA